MKRILCPKCENYLSFDETKYSEGQSLVFVCEHCGKQFSIRLGKSKMKAPRKEEKLDEDVYKEEFGCIVVIENVFGFKQVLPLQEGDNIIGRRCVGTDINTPIETGDMSMDRRHCIINVKRNRQDSQSECRRMRRAGQRGSSAVRVRRFCRCSRWYRPASVPANARAARRRGSS